MDASRVWIVWLWYAAIALDVIALPFGWIYLEKTGLVRILFALTWIAIIGLKIWCIRLARAHKLFRVTSIVSVVALLIVPIGIFISQFFSGWDEVGVIALGMTPALFFIPAFALSIETFDSQIFWGAYVALLLLHSTMTFLTMTEVKQ